MPQPREPELTFNQVKKDINLMELVLTLGYQHHRATGGADGAKGKFHIFDYRGNPRIDQVIIYQVPAGDYRYFNQADDRDKGSVIDFLKHRIEHPRIAGIRAAPGMNIWASILETARRFLNRPAPARTGAPPLHRTTAPVQPGDVYVPDFLQKTAPLTDTRYLNRRGITTETVTNACFAGCVLNYRHAGKSREGQAYEAVNTAFPQLYQGKIVGLEIKVPGFPGQAPDSLHSAALWLSNSTPRTHTLLVVERAIDALSHYQLKQPTHAFYASTAGQLTDNQIAEIKLLRQNHRLKTVKLALHNTVAGHVFDTRLIAGLAELATPMRIERNLPGLLTMGIYCPQEELISQLHRAAKGYNHQVTEAYRNVAGPEPITSPTVNTELITAAKVGEHSYQFHVPKRLEALAFFNQALLNSFPMVAKVELEKSRATDWNDQLKESLKSPAPNQAMPAGQPAPTVQAPAQEPAQTPAPRRGPRR